MSAFAVTKYNPLYIFHCYMQVLQLILFYPFPKPLKKALQNQILYNNLWKDGFVLSGMIISSIAAFINSVNGFIYLYSGKKIGNKRISSRKSFKVSCFVFTQKRKEENNHAIQS